MNRVIIFLILLFSYTGILSQSLKKYPIGNSGCSSYMLCNPGVFEKTYSEDSSGVYTGECKIDSLVTGLICVKLKEPIEAGKVAEELTISYMDYLKSAFQVKSSTGYGRGHTLEKKPEATGVIDYWIDEKGNEWKVKGWSDGKFIAVLYVYTNGKLTEVNRPDVFLNGFRFPEM
jgi:hypothetical protein